MWIWIAVSAIFILVLFHTIFPKNYHRPSVGWKLSKIPGPPGIPYFGNAFLFNIPIDEIFPMLINLMNKFNPILKLDLMGHIYIYCSDPDDIKVVLNSSQEIDKGFDHQILEPWLGKGLLTSSGEKWYKNRKLLTPAFHFKILESYIEAINKNAEFLLYKLMVNSKEDFVEIDPLISACTLDFICETAMGTKVYAPQGFGTSDYVKAMLRLCQLYRIRQTSPWLRNKWVFNLSSAGWEQRKLLNFVHEFTDNVIKDRKIAFKQKQKSTPILSEKDEEVEAEENKNTSFLDILIEMSEKENILTEDDVKAEVDTFMFQSCDKTASALIWTLYELGQNPDIQEKVYQEIESIFKDSNRSPTNDDLAEMKYLERVIKESWRLYPSIPWISRQLKEDIKIRDYEIPSGTNFAVLIYYIHRDPKIYPDPEKFDPDRFLPEKMQQRNPFAYIPFSAGPRNCIGQRFAMMEEKIILTQILRRFKVTSLDKREDIVQSAEIVLRPKNNLKMKFEFR